MLVKIAAIRDEQISHNSCGIRFIQTTFENLYVHCPR